MHSHTTTNPNVGYGEQQFHQPPVGTNMTGEQDPHRQQAAQDLLKQLQALLSEGQPGTEAVNEILARTEQLLSRQSQSPTADTDTRKVLEDISRLAGSAGDLNRNKDLGDRLNRIVEETKLALASANKANVPPGAREASQHAVALVETWRPLFQLLIRSRDFRVLLIDLAKIFRLILLRHGSGLGDYAQQQFVEGHNPQSLVKEVGHETKASFVTPTGDIQIAISDNEWEQIQDDLMAVFVMIGNHPNYREGLERLFRLWDLSQEHLRALPHSKQAAYVEPHAERARAETAELIASFAGPDAFYNWMDALRRVADRLHGDTRAQYYLAEVREFILSTKSPSYVQEEQYKHRSRELANKGRELVRDYKYADEVENLLNRTDELLENIQNDEYVSVLRDHAGIVASDLTYVDNAGNTQVDFDMLGKLRSVIIPILAETLKYIPLPRIEDSDKKREYWIDNIVLCGYDIVPENVKFHLESDAKFSVRKAETKSTDTRLVITLSKIRTELKDLEFHYHRKSFPTFTEQGRVNVRFGGHGALLRIAFEVEQDERNKVPRLTAGYADFQVSKMSIDYDKKSLHHDVLVPLLTNMFNLQIQQRIEKSVEDRLTTLIQSVGDRLTESLVQINRPFTSGVNTLREAVGTPLKEIPQTYENRQQKLE